MPNVVRISDPCTGHGCFPPRPLVSGSPNVITNNLNQGRVGDGYAAHCCGPVCHGGVQSTGSATVFVNNRQIARIGDSVSCGSSSGLGHSPNVIAGPL